MRQLLDVLSRGELNFCVLDTPPQTWENGVTTVERRVKRGTAFADVQNLSVLYAKALPETITHNTTL